MICKNFDNLFKIFIFTGVDEEDDADNNDYYHYNDLY